MGQNVNNLELVKDYANGQNFVRLHRDVLVPPTVAEILRKLLDAGRWEEAKAVVLEHATSDVNREVDLFFATTAAIGREVGDSTEEVDIQVTVGAALVETAMMQSQVALSNVQLPVNP